MATVLVINMGLKSVRAIIFNNKGQKLGSSHVAIRTAINDKSVEQNPEEWRKLTLRALGKAFYDAGKCKIDYITVTSSASCLVCVGEKGESLCNALMVSDKRAEKEAEYIGNLKSFKEVEKETGLAVSASLMLPKILWLKNNDNSLYKKVKHFLSPNDFLIQFLSGEIITDEINASKFHYSIDKKQYPLELLKELEIDVTTLPRVSETGKIVGTIKKEIASETGINADAKIVISSYDAICSFVGSGALKSGEASDVSGTVTVYRAVSKNNSISGKKVYSIPFNQGGYNIVGGSNNMGGGLIEWVKQCYYMNEDYPYEVMEKDARESELGAKGLIFLPYLLGERTPLWNDSARGVFFGIERMHTRKDMTRAVFESTGFIDRSIQEAIEEASGEEISTVRLSGGLARLNLVSQIKADVLGKEVMVLSEFETTSLGAAIIVLHGQDYYESLESAVEIFSRVRMIINPNQENHKKYNYMYELFKETYRTLEPLFKERIQLLEKVRSNREVKIENL